MLLMILSVAAFHTCDYCYLLKILNFIEEFGQIMLIYGFEGVKVI